jgi:hypothetical protein
LLDFLKYLQSQPDPLAGFWGLRDGDWV